MQVAIYIVIVYQTMINPPDDLLEDLQSALPPEQIAKSPLPHVVEAAEAIRRRSPSPAHNGHTSPSYGRLGGPEDRGDDRVYYDRIKDDSSERYEMPVDDDPRASTLSQVCVHLQTKRVCYNVLGVRCKPYHVTDGNI